MLLCAPETHDSILSAMTDKKNRIVVKLPDYPLFRFEDEKLRALIAVILGCDVMVKGIQQLGPKKIHVKIEKYLEENKDASTDDLRKHLMEWVCKVDEKKGKMTTDVLETYVNAFMYEPANEAHMYENGAQIEYIHGEHPPKLPMYLKDFCREGDTNTQIEQGPATCMCVGP